MSGSVAPRRDTRRGGDLRRHARWAYVLAAAALAAGALLLPRGDELLLIHVKNNDVARARDVLAQADTRGVTTAASVVAHGELFLYEGRVDDAITDTEAYAEARPNDEAAWTRLASLYQNAQRTADETRALAHVYRLAPTGARARHLVTRYRTGGDEAAEARVLQDLVKSGGADAAELVRSARLEAAFGRLDHAVATLEQLRRLAPTAIEYPEMELYGSLVIDTGKPDRLGRYLQSLPIVRDRPQAVSDLAAALAAWGHLDIAVMLLEPRPGLAPVPVWLTALAALARGTDQAHRVVERLAALDEEAPLGPDVRHAFVSLALSLPDYDVVERALTRDASAVEPDTVALAIGHAATSGARDRAQALVARLGDAALADSPMLALALAAERRDAAAVERWIAFVDERQPSAEVRAAIAQVEAGLGHDARAFDRLSALVGMDDVPAWAWGDWIGLAVRLDRVDETLAALEPIAERTQAAGAAWARLAATSGRTGRIQPWLSSHAGAAIDAEGWRDVYYALADRGETEAAVEVARRLDAATGLPDDRMRLGQALLAAGRPLDAVSTLRGIRQATADAAQAYDAALYAALAQGHDVARELVAVFAARLAERGLPPAHRETLVLGLWLAGERGSIANEILTFAEQDLDRWLSPLVEAVRGTPLRDRAIALVAAAAAGDCSPERREQLAHALIGLDAPDDVLLTPLARMAGDVGGSWVSVYDELLARLHRPADRITLWTTIGRAPLATPDERRAAASRLHELGATPEAIDLMASLAAIAGPLDADVESLLYFWGPRPSGAQRAWLVERLRQAPLAEQPAWIARLVTVGGARDVIDALPTLADTAPAELAEAWLDAHRVAADRERTRAALTSVIDRPGLGADVRRRIGRIALAEGATDLAERAFLAVAAEHPDDPEALRWLGTLSFYAGRRAEARRWLSAYGDAGGDHPEPLYQLGELALADRDAGRARDWFVRALARLDAQEDVDVNPGLRPNVLVRLDDRAGSVEAFETLLAAHPELVHLRADYAVALLGWNDYDRARVVLKLDAADGVSDAVAAADESGGRRIALLQVQWLNHHGRYRHALEILDDLASRFPLDPDVLVARAVFDADRGRLNQADARLETARVQAPTRDDIADLLGSRARVRAPVGAVHTEGRSVRHAWSQRLTTATFQRSFSAATHLVALVQDLQFSAPHLLAPDGVTRPVEARRRRFDATVTTPLASGTSIAATFFATSGSPGGGATLKRHDLFGATSLVGEFHRPFWEFPESAADGGWRDRLALERQWRLGARTSAWALSHWNRYGLDSGQTLSSGGLTLGIVRSVRADAPTIAFQYGLDLEHRISATTATTAEGAAFTPIPLASREVHVAGAISRFPAALWDVEASAGYTVDRLGGRGSFLTARATPSPGARLGVEFWMERRLFSVTTTQHEIRTGAALKVRF